MPLRDIGVHLHDILEASERIHRFIDGLSRDAYQADELVVSGVERQLTIIGKALNRLARVDQTLASRIPDYRRIIDFRNVLVHGYDIINQTLVWSICRQDLPLLERQVRTLLAELDDDEP